MTFDLVVPLWNEGCNVAALVQAVAHAALHEHGMNRLVLVNNGSEDDTGRLIDDAASRHSWIHPVHLQENLNYGGGVYEGFRHTRSDVLCYIPGDLQVMPDDVLAVQKTFRTLVATEPRLMVKGRRVIRHDPRHTQIVSNVYTVLANMFLGLGVKDVNGLPKMFHRDLIDELPAERMKTFVFDAQLITAARTRGWRIEEVAVTFHGRREGVSSWSSKRIRTYWLVLRQLLALRWLRYRPGIPLTPAD
jgi:glycosyltransferase involved in cell wall biosynthesis